MMPCPYLGLGAAQDLCKGTRIPKPRQAASYVNSSNIKQSQVKVSRPQGLSVSIAKLRRNA